MVPDGKTTVTPMGRWGDGAMGPMVFVGPVVLALGPYGAIFAVNERSP